MISQEILNKYPTIKEWKDDVFTVENFISEQEAEAMIKYLESLVESGRLKWNQISFYDSFAMGFWDSDPSLPDFGLPEDYFNRLKFKFKKCGEDLFGHKFSEISYHAQKWVEGAFADFHSDNSKDGKPTAFERSRYAGFLYLNDDFEGGILNFEHYEIAIKPKVGLYAIFKGGHGNEHEVTQVKNTKRDRYTIGSFWDDARMEYSDEQRQRWADELAATRKEQDVSYDQWAKDKVAGNAPVYKGKGEK